MNHVYISEVRSLKLTHTYIHLADLIYSTCQAHDTTADLPAQAEWRSDPE